MRRSVLLKVFAAVGVVALFAGVATAVLGVMAVRRGLSARDEPSALEVFAARTMRAMAIPAAVKAMKNPLKVTPETLADARAHWADHCAICHGNDGRGQTEIGRNLYPRPPDMRAEPTQSLTDGELYSIIENGIRLTGMPAWGSGHQGSEDSWALVAFIRHLPEQSAHELEEMKAENPRSPHEHAD